MFAHKIHDDPPRSVIFHWMLMSFLSGNVNAGGFLACGKFVSHVTGFATLFGISAAEKKWDAAFGILSVPLFFLIGVMLAAYLVERPQHKNQPPRYISVMSLICLCLLLSAVGGHWQWFGRFDKNTPLSQNYLLLALLCMASGLQNAAITTATGHTVRTTHLTGITTDLGIGLMRILSMPKNHAEVKHEKRAEQLRVGTIFSFAMGSAVGAALFYEGEYLGFLFPAALCLYVIAQQFVTGRRPRRSRSCSNRSSRP